MSQWLREYQLSVVDASGDGLDVSNLSLAFHVRRTYTSTPNEGEFRIRNLSIGTAKKAKEEFKRVQLKAGYTGASEIIFDGNIREARIGGDENSTYLDIVAGDGDHSFVNAVINKTLDPEYTFQQVFENIYQSMNNCGKNGVGLGQIDVFGADKFPRGKVLFGMSRDFMECLCFTCNKSWTVQNGKLQVVAHSKTLASAFVISPDTGMIGIPEEVNEGVRVKCLLNPKLMVDGQVKIESEHISAIAASASGFYRILQLDFVGDTHGDDWYSELICVAMDSAGGETTDSEGR